MDGGRSSTVAGFVAHLFSLLLPADWARNRFISGRGLIVGGVDVSDEGTD